MKARPTDERGSISAFVAVIALGLVMVAGLAFDGGQILAAQAAARDLAANAARAGAQQIDLDALRSDGVGVLDPEQAASAANAYLAIHGVNGTVTVDGPDLTVTVYVRAEMRILPIPDRTVWATDTATATPGVVSGDANDA